MTLPAAPASLLVEAFFSARRAHPPDDGAGFAARLAQRLDEASRAYPALRVPALVLARELGKRAASKADSTEALEGLHAGDVLLALAIAEGQPPAIAALERLLREQVRLAVVRLDDSPSFSDEVAQALRHKLLLGTRERAARILDYSGRGPLAKWLRAAALNTALSLRRGVPRGLESDEALADMPASEMAPELEFIKARYRAEFRAAFALAFQSLSSQQRNLLRLHYLEDLTLEQVGRHYHLHRTTVARQLEGARQLLVDETRRHVAESLRIGRDEFDSLVGLLRSQLDVSIRRFLERTRD